MQVTNGQIGIGIVKRGTDDFLVQKFFDVKEELEDAIIVFDTLDDADCVIIRNVEKDSNASSMVLKSITLYE